MNDGDCQYAITMVHQIVSKSYVHSSSRERVIGGGGGGAAAVVFLEERRKDETFEFLRCQFRLVSSPPKTRPADPLLVGVVAITNQHEPNETSQLVGNTEQRVLCKLSTVRKQIRQR